MAKDRRRISTQDAPALRQPLASLSGLRERLLAGDAPQSAAREDGAAVADAAPANDEAHARNRSTVFDRAPKLVVRRERKGHGGKTATRIEGLVGSTRELEAAVRDVKRALGCGATLDGRDVVVQGDQGDRLVAFLTERGARKIVVGS